MSYWSDVAAHFRSRPLALVHSSKFRCRIAANPWAIVRRKMSKVTCMQCRRRWEAARDQSQPADAIRAERETK